MLQRLVLQFSGVVVGRLFAAATQAITIVLLARWSAPEAFGLVIAVQSALGAVAVASAFGLPQYIGVLRAKQPDSPVVSYIFHLNRTTSWIASVLCLGILAAVGLSAPQFWALLPLGLALGPQRNAMVWDRLAVSDGQIRLFSSNLVLRRMATLLVFLAMHSAGVGVVLSYCTGVLAAQVLGNARMRHGCSFVPGNRARSDLRPVFKESRHFWVDSMSGMLRQLDVAAIGLVLGPLAAGYLAVPSRIASPVMLLPTSFSTLILPRVSAGRSGTARQGIYLAVAVSVLIAVVLAVVSVFLDEIIRLVLGESYLSAVPVTRIYFLGFVGLSLIYMLGAVLQGLGMHSAVGRNSMVFSVLTIVLLCIGGYFYGLEVAAWGYVVGVLSQVVGLVCLYVFRFEGTGAHIRGLPAEKTGEPLVDLPVDRERP